MYKRQATGSGAVPGMWKAHFKELLNSIKFSDSNLTQEMENSSHYNSIDSQMCTAAKVEALLHKLPTGKACGKDEIFAEHIIYADLSICALLSTMFNTCLVHGVLPRKCMDTIITPICKNKNGDITDYSNYRPVSLATVISKLFEHYILTCISSFIITEDNQFGFKAQHGTDLCVYTLKQTVSYFTKNNSNVFSVFLDASKAFDRTNNSLLFNKLISRKVPVCWVLLLASWYGNQQMLVKWGNTYSDPFHSINGVKQGVVLSPYLYAWCLDELSETLNLVRAGCCRKQMFESFDVC